MPQLDTPNQKALHKSRQAQLAESGAYIDSFLANLDPHRDYQACACPTCGQSTDRFLFIKRNGHYTYCSDCKHIYLSNPIRSEKLIEFYRGYPTATLEWHQNESDFYRRIYQRGLEMLQPHRHGHTILDIGCSSGFFLSIASEFGLATYGVEPNQKESTYAVDNGIKILGATLSDVGKELRFDVITLWDVLEHIVNPIGFINSLQLYLNPGGLVFVQVPSCDSLAARIMRGGCNMFDGIEHLTLFSFRSLDKAFEKAGFSLVCKESVISESHAIANYLSYESDPYLGDPKDPFSADFLSSDSIESSGLGYKIQALYRIHQ